MATAESQAGALQVRVLEGELSVAELQPGEEPGIIKLAGWAAPFQSFTIEGGQRVKTTFYPGNKNASQQPLGSTKKPTVLNGEWNDRKLGDGAAAGYQQTFQELADRGVSVEVTWGGAVDAGESPSASGRGIVRVGVISNAKFTFPRVQDCQWELTFEWRSDGDPAAPAVTSTPAVNPRQDAADATDALEMSSASWTAFAQGPGGANGFPQLAEQAMETAQAGIDTAVGALQDAQAQVQAVTVIPTAAALRMVAACEDGLRSVRIMESTLLNLDLLQLEVRDSALDLLRAADDRLQQLAVHGESRERLVRLRTGVVELVEPDVIAEVEAPAGTSYRDLALRYYGDPDLGWSIAAFNGVDGMLVPSIPTGPGDVVPRPTYIPRVQPGAATDLGAQC